MRCGFFHDGVQCPRQADLRLGSHCNACGYTTVDTGICEVHYPDVLSWRRTGELICEHCSSTSIVMSEAGAL